MTRRISNLLVFLVLTAEADSAFERHWATPWHYLWQVLIAPIPGARLWVVDGLVFALALAAYAKRGARRGRARPLDRAILVAVASVGVWSLMGLLRGGSALNLRLQVHVMVMMYLTTLVFLAVYRTVNHFVELGKIVVYASLFRALMAFLFYLIFVKGDGVFVECVLGHGDSILFATSTVIVLCHALHTGRLKTTAWCLAVAGVMLWSIQINNRRLAWVGLIGGLTTAYALLVTVAATRRRLHRIFAVAVPIIVVYVCLGWGRHERIFAPLRAFSSMGPESKDPSTASRNLENLGLATTLANNVVFGTGFGHEYVEVSSELAPVREFPQYRYVPHNSVLGLAVFMGALGFLGLWMPFPVAVFLAARSYRFAGTPQEKTVAAVATAEVFIHMNQMYGDMGSIESQGLVMMPIAFAAASRLSILTRAYPASETTEVSARARSRGAQASGQSASTSPPWPLSG